MRRALFIFLRYRKVYKSAFLTTENNLKLLPKVIFLLACFGLCEPLCFAAKDIQDEKTKPYEVKRVVKTVDGHNFIVPEDRPIEMIAGQYRPVDMGTYVAYKFGTLEEEMDVKFAGVEEKLAEFTGQSEKILKLEQEVKDLNTKVDDLTKHLKKIQEGSGGQAPTVKGS